MRRASLRDVGLSVLVVLTILLPGTYIRRSVAKARLERDFHTQPTWHAYSEDRFQLLTTLAGISSYFPAVPCIRCGLPYLPPEATLPSYYSAPDMKLVIWYVAYEDDS